MSKLYTNSPSNLAPLSLSLPSHLLLEYAIIAARINDCTSITLPSLMSAFHTSQEYFKPYQYILILGFGVEGRGVCKFLQNCGYEGKILVYDERFKSQPEPAHATSRAKSAFDNQDLPEVDFAKIQFVDTYDLNVDLLVRSPGFKLSKKYYEDKHSHKVTSATNLFFELVAIYTKSRIIGVTGTKGKSTVSSMIHHLLKDALDSRLVGNIGAFCLDALGSADKDTVFVFELSSYQLEDCAFYPDTAVLLEVMEDHLDFHGSKEAYRAAKLNLLRPQASIAPRSLRRGAQSSRQEVITTHRNDALFASCGVKRPNFLYFEDAEISIEGLGLLGDHNVANAKIASLSARIYGIDKFDFAGFKSLPRRLEEIGRVGDLVFVDDSLATVPSATIAGIESLGEVRGLILGGLDRGIDFAPLVAFLKNYKPLERVILMGGAGARLANVFKAGEVQFKFIQTEDLHQAFAELCKCSQGYVLLSPSSPRDPKVNSYTYERGEILKRLIHDRIQ